MPSKIASAIGNFFTTIFEFLANIVNYLNPTSENFILKKLWEFFTELLSYLNPLHENFILRDIVDFVVNFVDIIIHIVVPTDSQWEEIKSNYSDLGTTITEHIPFWSFVKSTITDAQNTDIIPNDFLVIKMPSFSFYGGQTEETKYFDVLEAYEPYRIQVRGLLLLIVYVCAFVYIIKLITDYSANVGGSNGLDNIKAGNRLRD